MGPVPSRRTVPLRACVTSGVSTMDGLRFDALTRTFTAVGSRRRALAAALTGSLGLLGLTHPGDAPAGGKCKPACTECQFCKKGKKGKKGKCKPSGNGTACSVGTCQGGSCVAPPPPTCPGQTTCPAGFSPSCCPPASPNCCSPAQGNGCCGAEFPVCCAPGSAADCCPGGEECCPADSGVDVCKLAGGTCCTDAQGGGDCPPGKPFCCNLDQGLACCPTETDCCVDDIDCTAPEVCIKAPDALGGCCGIAGGAAAASHTAR